MIRTLSLATAPIILATAAASLVATAQAKPAPSTIFRFAGGKSGFEPTAGLIADSNGVLYGTTSALSSRKGKVFGTVFSLTHPTGKTGQWRQTVLWRFRGGNDGANPLSTLVMDSSGNLYGTTLHGNPSEAGTVFELSPPSGARSSWTETIIHNFGGSGDGTDPTAGLIQAADGKMYGITGSGGPNGKGVVFQLTPPPKGKGAWTETVLYSFSGGSTDGEFPQGALFLDNGGVLYGTTQYGGIDGSNCNFDGNSGCGTVFSLTPPANGQTQWTESILHFFTGGADGNAPLGKLITDGSGNLLGTTSSGGINSEGPCADFPVCGVVFELSPPAGGGSTWSESTLYTFQNESDGAGPAAGVLRNSDGTLYTTVSGGGSFGLGAVDKLSPPTDGGSTWSETTLHNFGQGNDGAVPLGDIIQGADGYLYGTTSRGGRPRGFGTVFQVAP